VHIVLDLHSTLHHKQSLVVSKVRDTNVTYKGSSYLLLLTLFCFLNYKPV